MGLTQKNAVLEFNNSFIENYKNCSDRKYRYKASMLAMVNQVLSNSVVENIQASKGANFYNIGQSLESVARYYITNNLVEELSTMNGIDGLRANGSAFEIKTFVLNGSHELTRAVDTYIMVINANVKGIYKVTKKDIEKYGLLGMRFNQLTTLTYGTLLKGFTKKLMKGLGA